MALIFIPGRASIPTGADPAAWIQGPNGDWYLAAAFNPTPWIGVVHDAVPPPPPPPPPTTITLPKPLAIQLYAALPGAQSRLAFLQEMGGIVLEDLDGTVEDATGVVIMGFGLKALPDFGKHAYGDIAAALQRTGIDFVSVAMQPYSIVAGSGTPAAIVHWRQEQRLAVLAVNRTNGKVYRGGGHNMTLVERTPEIFAVEVANALA